MTTTALTVESEAGAVQGPAAAQASKHPVTVYLAGLAEGSVRVAMAFTLRQVAAILARYDRRPEDAKCRAAALLHVPYIVGAGQ